MESEPKMSVSKWFIERSTDWGMTWEDIDPSWCYVTTDLAEAEIRARFDKKNGIRTEGMIWYRVTEYRKYDKYDTDRR